MQHAVEMHEQVPLLTFDQPFLPAPISSVLSDWGWAAFIVFVGVLVLRALARRGQGRPE